MLEENLKTIKRRRLINERAGAVTHDPLKYGDITKIHIGDDVLVFISGIPRALYISEHNIVKLSREFAGLEPEDWFQFALNEALPNVRAIPLETVEQEYLDHCLHVKSPRTMKYDKSKRN